MTRPLPRSASRRARVRATSALLALAGGLGALGGPADAGATDAPQAAPAVRRTADQPRTGYELRPTGTAAGGWLGSRVAGGRVVFRIDPGASATTPGFAKARVVSTLSGSGAVEVTRRRTSRAAWVVAKYGTFRSRAQAAAVELTLDELLSGGDFGVHGAATRRRLAQVPDDQTILGMVAFMLDKSKTLAGPYRIQVEAGGGLPTGVKVPFSVTVTAVTGGAPIPGLPVDLNFGATTLHRETDDAGQVSVLIASSQPGPQQMTATVRLLPTDSLLVRAPSSGRGSRVVVAGRKRGRAVSRTVAVVAQPLVVLATPHTARITDPLPGTLTVTGGYASPRAATYSLHGPFALGSDPGCTPDTVQLPTRQATVAADGDYGAPSLSAVDPGVYNWSVSVAADTYNQAASACGDTFRVQAVPDFSVRSGRDTVPVGAELRVKAHAAALPATYTGRAVARLYGPFPTRADVRCVDARIARRRFLEMTGPSSDLVSTPVTLDQPGVYAWQATLPGSPLAVSSDTACRAPNTVVRVG